jgi:dipeptidyl-peptidase 4
MKKLILQLVILTIFASWSVSQAQEAADGKLLTIDRIFNSGEFSQGWLPPVQWIENGASYVTIEKSAATPAGPELVKYTVDPFSRTLFVPSSSLTTGQKPLGIEGFSLSPDESKVLFFTNSSRVWRTNTKGDYWVYDIPGGKMYQIGKQFKASSLMFAKFQPGNRYVAYVHDFNIYAEDTQTGAVKQLTYDGNGKIINGTFDWVYEEEFGIRDGFSWNPDGGSIAFWQLDASKIGTFYLINNTDSVYSKPIPIQYPKVGQEPSAARIGIANLADGKISWIRLEGGEKENYIPGMQWINPDLLLIQQINRKQNQLTIWTYQPSTGQLSRKYVEKEETWVDINAPDLTSSMWGSNDLRITDNGTSFLRMAESDGWRRVFKVNLTSGEKRLLTPGNFDVASIEGISKQEIFFIASPDNSTQRYLFSADLKGKGTVKRLTPPLYSGVNTYNISPDGRYAVHSHLSTTEPRTSSLITLPGHKILRILSDNHAFKQKLQSLAIPEIRFFKVTTEDGIEMDVRMIMPLNFDPSQKYPLLLNVYGEPWGQNATDTQVGLYNIMLAQKGYVVVDMDPRGTPCLKGTSWRKSVYRKIGIVNVRDQALGAKEVFKLSFIDKERTAVWGWSGGGSMTLNLMFQYPGLFRTGMAVAAVSNQLLYDNVYQERYMGLPEENMEDFVKGSPVTYAGNLEGNLLIVHGTGDDNVHYQNAEVVINELIRQNKQFQMMAYPNRSHGIYEGENTTRHLYTLLTGYLLSHTPPNK